MSESTIIDPMALWGVADMPKAEMWAIIRAAYDMREALESILPYVPISSASEGGAVSKCRNVVAADMVRAALKAAREPEDEE